MKTASRISYSIKLNLLLFIALFIGLANIQAQNTIDGYAYLENETDHSGVMVVFERTAPSTSFDTTYTDSTGYYSKVLSDGWYNISYSKEAIPQAPYFKRVFLDSVTINNSLYANTSLANVQLSFDHFYIDGNISGVLPDTMTYYVDVNDTIKVASDDTLNINAGVEIYFKTDALFLVNGSLYANGTQNDTIRFVGNDNIYTGRIIFESSISKKSLFNFVETYKSAIYIYQADFTINNSKIVSQSYHKGINVTNSILNVNNCMFVDGNSGVYINNTSYTNNNSYTNIQNSLFTQNQIGVVQREYDGGKLFICNNLFIDNQTGASLRNPNTSINDQILNNIFIGNVNGIYISTDKYLFNNNIIVNSSQYGIKSNSQISLNGYNNNIYNNTTNYINCGAIAGTIVITNINGDSCDAYGNISEDPQFTDTANGDFHLLPTSPCIDAGTQDTSGLNIPALDYEGNARIFDGDYDGDTIIDMGIYEYSIPSTGLHDIALQIWQAPLNSQGFYSAAEQLTVQIKNNGTVADSNFIVSYSINNGTTWITDTFNNVLGAYNTASFSFTQTANLHTPGTYNCLVAVSVPNDNDTSNDTLAITLQSNSYNIIDGYATIQGETDHAGIRVIFKQTSPSNSQDTVYTASNGYYEFYGSQGNYEVYFIKPCGSTPDTLYNQSCFNTLNTLSSVSLFKTLSGNLSGTLSQGTYYIGCDVTVPAGDSLIIEPGTEMLFFDNAALKVYGVLNAIGTSSDSIVFTSIVSGFLWNGIKFYGPNQSSIRFANISNALTGTNDGVVRVDNSKLIITNSTIKNNSKGTFRAAIYTISKVNILVDSCRFFNNQEAFHLFGNSLSITSIKNTQIFDCIEGIYNMSSNPIIENCKFYKNQTVFRTDNGTSKATIINTLIYNNHNISHWGRTDLKFYNSIIINNNSVFSDYQSHNFYKLDIKNSIIVNNASVFTLGSSTSHNITFNNNVFYENFNLDTSYLYGLNILQVINPNGDSTDTYGNLFMDPQLADTINGDFHLSYGSPAIDAGNNLYVNSTTDFDGNQRVLDGNGDNNNVLDIGPYEYQFTQVLTDIGVLSLSTSSPCAGVQDIKAVIRNFGQDTIHSFSIALKINDTLQNTFSWQGTITSGDTINVVLDSIFNPYNSQTYNLLAYPILVNSISDTVTINDTASLTKTYLAPSSLNFPNIGSVCIDSSIVNIDIATPSGGIYTGAGVQQNSFYPSQIGAGVHQINYIYTDSNQCVNIINSSITVLDLPQISFSSINPINYCQDGSKSILSAIPSGGVFSGATTDSVFYADSLNTGINQITYKYTDANSCSNIDTLSIEVFDLPNVSLGTQANVCESQNSIILTGGLPASGYYTGKGVDSTQSKLYIDSVGVGLSEIIYNYIDNHSCMNSDTQNIRVVSVPNASFSIAPTVCKNDTVDINNTSNASTNAIFNWNFDNANVYSGGTSDSVLLSWNSPGIKLISLNITDSLCTSSNVYNYTNVLETVSIASIAGNDSACFGDSILLTAYQNGSNSFQWLDSLQQPISTAINQNYFAKNSGEYYLKTSNSIGCSDISSPLNININPFIVSDFTLASQACKNSMVNIQYNSVASANAVYNWNFDGGAIGSGSNSGPYNIIWNTDSIKYVSLYVQENNCTSDLSTKSIEINSPLAEIIPLTNTTICNGENVGLSANYGNFSYNWFKDGISLQDTSAVFFASQSGTYFIEVTDLSNLCTNTSDSVSVIVNTTDFNLAFTANQVNFNIPPFNVNFINQTPNNTDYFFNWDLGDGTTSNYISPSHQYAYDGDFDVSIVAQNIVSGCYDTLSKIDYIHCDGGMPDPCSLNNKIGNTSGNYVCPGDSIKLFSKEHGVGVNYQWLKGGVIISNAIDSVYYATETGLYQLMVSDTNCSKFSQPYPITKRTVITPVILANGSLQYCSNDSLELYVNSSYANYQWSNGATSQSIFVNTSSNYIVTVIDNNSCQIVSTPYTLNTAIVPAPQICIVGIDTATNHNRIVWERNNSTLIDSFRIYRESSVSGIYNLIGNQPFSTPGLFQDINSNPAQQAYSYKISAIDTCGMESPLSIMHKTIHLTINSGLGGVWNLIWNHYQGFAYNSYRIYRGTDSINMTLLTQIQSSVNSYTDLTPPAGNVYYQIEVVSPHSCYPDSVFSKANTNYNYSRSNTANSELAPNIGFANILQGNLSIALYPNPNKGQFTLELNSTTSQMQTYQLEVYSVMGELIHSEALSFGSKLNKEMHFEHLSKGVYFVRLRSKDNVLMSRFIVE